MKVESLEGLGFVVGAKVTKTGKCDLQYVLGQITEATVWMTPVGEPDEAKFEIPSTRLADEYIEVVRVPGDQALAMARDGRITDGKTICALFRALCH